MLAVARANACRWCTLAHRQWALAEGVTDAELAALEDQRPEQFDRRMLDELLVGTSVAVSIPLVAGYLALARRRGRPRLGRGLRSSRAVR